MKKLIQTHKIQFNKSIKKIYFVLTSTFLITTSLLSQSWQVLPDSPTSVFRFEDVWFINENTGWVVDAFIGERILKTTNGGINWVVQFTSKDPNSFRSVAFNNESLGWAGGINGSLLKTTNGGANWTKVDTLINPLPPGICDISVVGDSTFYGAGKYIGPARLIKSTNTGITFQSIDLSGYANTCIAVYFKNKDSGYVGGESNIPSEGSVILYTTNGGDNWTKIYTSNVTPEHVWYIIPFNENILYASVQHYMPNSMYYLISTNGGTNWNRYEVGNDGQYAEAIGFTRNMTTGWIASGTGTGMYQTTNTGLNWTFLNFGQRIHSMFVVNDTTVYACGKSIYKYSADIVGIQYHENVLPEEFQILYPNYPNPFNPVTTIKFYLRFRSQVKLNIYSLKGQLMATLINEFKNPGYHVVTWDASSLPTGVYFYSIMTNGGMSYKKALLVK